MRDFERTPRLMKSYEESAVVGIRIAQCGANTLFGMSRAFFGIVAPGSVFNDLSSAIPSV
jgi:predicted benzoate:H+ symporter BenE